jgi:predicted PhzF superfamily epimerase YddE/YHI9
MVFPSYSLQAVQVPTAFLEALGVSRLLHSAFNQETNIILIEVECSQQLAQLRPDYQSLVASYPGLHGIVVTSRSSDGIYDFHSCYFWPWCGGTEDPVTGGTHTFLTRYWSERLGKTKMKSFQSSKRTGCMEVELTQDQKVLITASAVIVMEGTWIG